MIGISSHASGSNNDVSSGLFAFAAVSVWPGDSIVPREAEARQAVSSDV